MLRIDVRLYLIGEKPIFSIFFISIELCWKV